MSNFEQSRTERGKGNNSVKSRTIIARDISNSIETELIRSTAENQRKERENRIGHTRASISTLILEGSNDRLRAIPYNPNKYENHDDQGAYEEGFYEHGNRQLMGNLDTLSSEQLVLIGKNDYLCGIKGIPQMIQDNTYYMKGYVMGMLEPQPKKAGGRK